jgi:uncharacterized protein (TIGR02391 family)
MVPIDFYRYRESIKRALLARKAALSSAWDPFNASWILYAFSQEDMAENQLVKELATELQRWADGSTAWEWQRNLGPLAFLCWLKCQSREPDDTELIAELSKRVQKLDPHRKWDISRHPEQFFLLVLGLGSREDARPRLIEVAKQQIGNGSLWRRILYAAALREMKEAADVPAEGTPDIVDLIGLVWWAERYRTGNKKHEQWQRFAAVSEAVSLEDAEEVVNFQRRISVPELALLYEAVCCEVSQPDPMLLFEYFPLHPRIQEIARDHFRNGKYATAVDQACKVLNELIQKKSGTYDKNESELVQSTMKQIHDPRNLKIKFNEFLADESGKNEQSGLALICEGVFKAFRNPKGHKPEDHPLAHLEPYEALAQLVTISYLMKRTEQAHR